MKNHGPATPAFPHMLHGGDYNPDQWMHIDGIWDEDMRLMKLSKCNAMSVGIFSWATYEPEEGKYEFEWMDRVMDMLEANGGKAVLATPSGAKPAWLALKYPEVRRVNAHGVRDKHGGRHNHCYTSPVYREKTVALNTMLAERYKDHPALILWHVSNEYGGQCFCDLCFAKFRSWLKERYGSLDALNQAWWSTFWSHRISDWEHITHVDGSIHGMVIDWKRFVTQRHIDFFLAESKPLRDITPHVPVTINMMGTYPLIDYFKFAPHVDVVSWDSYPAWHSEARDADVAAHIAFLHDLNRGLKKGKPFLLMESTPSSQNWKEICRAKRPGMHLLSSLQAVAHGSDSVQYFQWRKSRGSCEKFHGAVVDHCAHENNRVFRDVTDVGEALAKLDAVVGTSVEPEVAVLYDWENRWAIDEARGPHNKNKEYIPTITNHYREFWKRGVPVDIVDEDCDFTKYKVLVAPMLYMVRAGVGERIASFVERGGVLVTTYLAGQVDDSDLCYLGGFPGGALRTVMGIWAEETDVFYPSQTQSVVASDNDLGLSGAYAVRHYADIVHLEGATALTTYGEDFYAGSPAVTVNAHGNGRAYYIASRNDARFLDDFYAGLIASCGVAPALAASPPDGVSVTTRRDDRNTFVFVLNFNDSAVTVELGASTYADLLEGDAVTGAVELPAFGVKVLRKDQE